jgi:hypothetical protein
MQNDDSEQVLGAEREFQQSRKLAARHKLLLFRASATKYLIFTKDGRGKKRAIEYDAQSRAIRWLGIAIPGKGSQYTTQQMTRWRDRSLFGFVEFVVREEFGVDLGRLSKRQILLKVVADDGIN